MSLQKKTKAKIKEIWLTFPPIDPHTKTDILKTLFYLSASLFTNNNNNTIDVTSAHNTKKAQTKPKIMKKKKKVLKIARECGIKFVWTFIILELNWILANINVVTLVSMETAPEWCKRTIQKNDSESEKWFSDDLVSFSLIGTEVLKVQ